MAADSDLAGGGARAAALAWFVRLQSGDAGPADRAAFAEWLARDPAHRREYEALGGLWADLGGVPDPRRRPRPPSPARSPARSSAPTRRRVLMGGGAALAAGVAGLAVTTDAWRGGVRTGTGERRSLALDDGSVVELDAGSALRVEFSSQERRLRLTEGRAQFVVARDPERPFVVACVNGRVEALGTVFVVHRHPDSVVVAVEEGSVALSVEGAPPARLAAGQCRRYGPDGPGPLLRDGVAAETAWRRGRLVFQDQRLADVVADLNRYHPARILLWDAALADLRVDGSVDLSRPDAALNAIARTLPVRTLRPIPSLILLRSA